MIYILESGKLNILSTAVLTRVHYDSSIAIERKLVLVPPTFTFRYRYSIFNIIQGTADPR